MFTFLALFSFSTGSGVCSVVQNPPDLIKSLEEVAEIKCAHTVKNYNRILWYKHSHNTGLTLMENLNVGSPQEEAEFKNED